MRFREQNGYGEFPVTMHAWDDETLIDEVNGVGCDLCTEIREFLASYLLDDVRIVIVGRFISLYFKNDLDRVYFKLRFYEGKCS